MSENIERLEHNEAKNLIELKGREMYAEIIRSNNRIKYYMEMIRDQRSNQRYEEFSNKLKYETYMLEVKICALRTFKEEHAEYFI